VTLTDGTFETQVSLGGRPDPNTSRITRRYQFESRADTVYWARTSDNPRANVRVEGPGEPAAGRREPRPEVAFMAQKDGTHTVCVECEPFAAGPCKLKIRAMDGTEPLPPHLRLKPADVVLPRIAEARRLNVYDKQFTGAAFAPDGKSFWIAHGDGTLSFWEQPELKQKGGYKTPDGLYALGVDGQGRLYAQVVKGNRDTRAGTRRPTADLSVWEKLAPADSNPPLPAPSKTIPLRGIIQRLINSPDGRWLYFLDVHNRKLGRIDTAKVAVDKEIDTLSPGTSAVCLTPDGKKIYRCSDANRIDIIDTARFKLDRTVSLNKGKPTDIAASNEGLVLLVGEQVEGSHPQWGGNSMMVDLTRGVPDKAPVIPFPTGHYCQFVVLLPDQRAALFSGDRRVSTCSLPSRPALFRAVTGGQWGQDYFLPGQVVLSPDGRTLLYHTGVVLSISR
jgi:hypothetical protein